MYIFLCCLTNRIGLLYSNFLFMELWLLCSQRFHVSRLLMILNLNSNQKSILIRLWKAKQLFWQEIEICTRNRKWHLKIFYHFHGTLRISKLWNSFWNRLISFFLAHPPFHFEKHPYFLWIRSCFGTGCSNSICAKLNTYIRPSKMHF
jgi:hypothetical protein